jgi:hypothetical protein
VTDRLVATFDDDHDGTGKLTVVATFSGFSGRSGAYFSSGELLDFAERLGAFPLPDDGVVIAGGFWDRNAREVLEQELVRIAVVNVGHRGQVGLVVHLQTEWWEGDDRDAVQDVRLRLLTTYARLDQFRQELARVVNGDLDEAVLPAEVL